MDQWACSQRNDSDPFLIWKPDFILVNAKLFQIRHLKRGKRGVLDRDSPRKSDSEVVWTQRSFGTWFLRAHFGNAHWSHAWINQRGLHSRNKILPRSAQILFVIGTAFAMHVNAHVQSIRTAFGTWFVSLWTGPLYNWILELNQIIHKHFKNVTKIIVINSFQNC